jgi:hypothetical protein
VAGTFLSPKIFPERVQKGAEVLLPFERESMRMRKQDESILIGERTLFSDRVVALRREFGGHFVVSFRER